MPDNKTNPFSLTGRHQVLFLLIVLLSVPLLAATPNAAKPEMPRAQKHEVRREIEQLEDAWRDAALKGDADAMAALLADDYLAITPTGTLQSKEQALANLRDGRIRFSSIEYSDRKYRFYASTALVNSRAEVSGSSPEGPIAGSFRHTRVYVRDAHGKWKIVSFEASHIRESGERR